VLDGDDQSKENMFLERANTNSGFTIEDMLHFQQVATRVVKNIHDYFASIKSLRSYLIAIQALHHVLGHPVPAMAQKLRAPDSLTFRFYCVQFETLILPLRSETAFNGVI
jgi:hypothetical protein